MYNDHITNSVSLTSGQMYLSIALSISVLVTGGLSRKSIASLFKLDTPGWKQFLFCWPGFAPVRLVTTDVNFTGGTTDFDCGTLFF